jgi:hypothetical protein
MAKPTLIGVQHCCITVTKIVTVSLSIEGSSALYSTGLVCWGTAVATIKPQSRPNRIFAEALMLSPDKSRNFLQVGSHFCVQIHDMTV